MPLLVMLSVISKIILSHRGLCCCEVYVWKRIYVDIGQPKVWTLDVILKLIPQNGFLCK